jgi:hypothetical protein
MMLHKREAPLRTAQNAFVLYWIENLDAVGVKTYEDANYVANHLDAFWNNTARKGLSPSEALAAWQTFDTASLDLAPAIRSMGEYLGQLVEKHELTHSEINYLLANARNHDARFQLRAERHPEDPDQPAGLE